MRARVGPKMEGFGEEMREIWKREGEKWCGGLKTRIRVLSGEDEVKNGKDGLTQGIYTMSEFGFVFVARFAFSLRFRNSLFQNSKLTDMFV
ncbi:hypothetical protein E3N88_23394 [Mikania micrantha]|uniref:Uncharacterized protein n=1 Tax=Mikania micrantha TaxID=192012 RepID=A0A5N6NES1_9ASTR|nr:hypothetical protein E3N88_23394 [Mikania micrantha]